MQLVSVTQQVGDSRTPEGRLMQANLATWAAYYSWDLSRKTKSGKDRKAKEGWYPSEAPLGYKNEGGIIVPDPEMAPLVKDAYEMYVTGDYTLRELTEKLGGRGLVGKRKGKPLSISRIRGLLQSVFYIGKFVWGGVECDGKHEPIVSKEMWLRVRAELKRRGELSIQKKKHNHPMKGIVHCSCGRKMTMDAAKNKYLYFVCKNEGKCGQPGVPAEVVDEHIQKLMDEFQLSEGLLEKMEAELKEMAEKREGHRDRYAAQLERRLLRLDHELEKAYEGWKRGIVPDELFIPDQKRIQQERLLIEADLETVSIRLKRTHELAELGMELAHNCGEAWRVASETVRTKMAQAFFERITTRQRKVVAVKFGEPFSSISRGSLKNRQRRPTEHLQNSLNRLRRLTERRFDGR